MIAEYITKRTKICRTCPICNQDEEICSADLYINPDTNDVSSLPKEGYIKGCGCHLRFKVKNKQSFCPAHKWEAEY